MQQARKTSRSSSGSARSSSRRTATGWNGLSCLERVVLYGSRARGDHRPDSDFDVAVFIKDPGTLTEELDKLASLTTAILLETGAVISAKPFEAGAYRARTAFMHDVRKDGLDL
jgi:predicted nucleotidyltransferase